MKNYSTSNPSAIKLARDSEIPACFSSTHDNLCGPTPILLYCCRRQFIRYSKSSSSFRFLIDCDFTEKKNFSHNTGSIEAYFIVCEKHVSCNAFNIRLSLWSTDLWLIIHEYYFVFISKRNLHSCIVLRYMYFLLVWRKPSSTNSSFIT